MKHRVKKFFKSILSKVFLDSVELIKKCGLNLVLFELTYKLCAIVVLYPMFLWGMNFTLEKAGFKYLTNDYFFTYVKSPFSIVFFIVILLVVVFYITFEIACLSVCFDAGYHNVNITIAGIYKAGMKLLGRILKKRPVNAFFHVVAVYVMMNITLMGFWLSSIAVPDFVKRTIWQYRKYLIIVAAVLLVFFIYCLFNMFIMNYMAFAENSIVEAKRRSARLIKHHGFSAFFTMLGWNVIILAGLYFLYFVVIVLVCAGVFVLKKSDAGMAIYLSIFRVVIILSKIILALFSISLSYGVITSMFYRYRSDSGNIINIGEITEEINRKKPRHPLFQRVFSIIIIVCSLSVNIFYVVRAFDNNPFDNVEIFGETQTMAHRGCSYNAPENTMLAFMNAVDATADYVELDVHETKDGEIVVMHDANLKRTTGLNRNIWNVTYDEIKNLDAGSFFGDDEEFAQCRIPKLSEVMEYAKGKIKLNIEIKLSDNEPDMVEKVVEFIHQYRYEEDCYVTSMNYEALKDVKKLDANIKTGYVLTVAYGNFYNLDYVDAFSINSSFVNKNMVDAIHNRGKKIFVWTVNGKDRARELTIMGVDAIITDNPVMAREVVYSKYSNTLIQNVLGYVLKK